MASRPARTRACWHSCRTWRLGAGGGKPGSVQGLPRSNKPVPLMNEAVHPRPGGEIAGGHPPYFHRVGDVGVCPPGVLRAEVAGGKGPLAAVFREGGCGIAEVTVTRGTGPEGGRVEDADGGVVWDCPDVPPTEGAAPGIKERVRGNVGEDKSCLHRQGRCEIECLGLGRGEEVEVMADHEGTGEAE